MEAERAVKKFLETEKGGSILINNVMFLKMLHTVLNLTQHGRPDLALAWTRLTD